MWRARADNVVCLNRNLATWPAVMSLTPAREQAAPTAMLHAWLRRHNGYLFNVTPFQIGDNGSDNQENHRSLVRLLNDKNIVCSLSSL